MNVKYDGKREITEAPASVTPMQVKDEGRTAQTDAANIRCSGCDGHVGWKIVRNHLFLILQMLTMSCLYIDMMMMMKC